MEVLHFLDSSLLDYCAHRLCRMSNEYFILVLPPRVDYYRSVSCISKHTVAFSSLARVLLARSRRRSSISRADSRRIEDAVLSIVSSMASLSEFRGSVKFSYICADCLHSNKEMVTKECETRQCNVSLLFKCSSKYLP